MNDDISLISQARRLYPGIDWIDMIKVFKIAWEPGKLIHEKPEDTEKRIIEVISRYRLWNRNQETETDHNQLHYLLIRRYLIHRSPSQTGIYFNEDETKLVSHGQDFRNVVTSEGELACATGRLHDIDRLLIELVREEFFRAVERSHKAAPLTLEAPRKSFSFLKRKIKQKKET